MGYFIIWILCGIAAAYIASQKGKDGGMWVLLGILFGPFALLMVGFSRAEPERSNQNSSSSFRFAMPAPRTCPFCAEEIKWEAKVCKHCGRDVPTESPLEFSPIKIAYNNLQQANGGRLSLGAAKSALELQGFPMLEIADLLDEIEATGRG